MRINSLSSNVFFNLVATCISIFALTSFASAAENKASEKNILTAEKNSTPLERFLKNAKNLEEDFEIKFVQTNAKADSKKIKSQNGVLLFSPPANVRWEVLNPKPQLYVVNKKDGWKYVPALKHAQRIPAGDGELKFLEVVLKPHKIPESYKIESWPESETKPENADASLLFKLVPKTESSQKAVLVQLDSKTGTAKTVVLLGKEIGSKTTIQFETPKLGKISSTQFDFTPPPGVAVDKL